jgi:hypothetical protein
MHLVMLKSRELSFEVQNHTSGKRKTLFLGSTSTKIENKNISNN